MDITTINDSGAQANQKQGNGFTQYSWSPAQAQAQAGSKSLSGWRNDHDDGGRAAWGAEKRELEKIIEQKTTEAQIQEAENLDLHQQLAEAKMAISELRQNNKGLSDTLHTERERAREIKSALSTHEQLKRSYQQLGREYTSKMELLRTRTEELALAQAYMTTADTCSVADISRMVEQLNDDMYQFAVLISDAVLKARSSKMHVPHEVVARARSALEEIWSEGLVRKMYMAVAEEDTVLLECLLQSVLANWCHDVVQCFADDGGAEDFLQALWNGINRSREFITSSVDPSYIHSLTHSKFSLFRLI
jgi:myosin heavy subunit